MCGIGGILQIKNKRKSVSVGTDFKSLLKKSEARGRDASGVVFIDDFSISTIKASGPAKNLFKHPLYRSEKRIFENSHSDSIGILGHTRLATNGDVKSGINNQPIFRDGIVCIHNGIITNYLDIFKSKEGMPSTELDSELIPFYYRKGLEKGLQFSEITEQFFSEVEGTASFACLFEDYDVLLLATNNGALYYCHEGDKFIFASQRDIVASMSSESSGVRRCTRESHPVILNLRDLSFVDEDKLLLRGTPKIVKVNNIGVSADEFSLKDVKTAIGSSTLSLLENCYNERKSIFSKLRRCSKCILPETFPFITFSADGVCNYCANYMRQELLGENRFKEAIIAQAKTQGKPKILVGLSGGRDSCYALHLVRQYFDDVYAFSYDWGVITDLARRNQARMCEKLNVEHIFVAADLKHKRQNIRLNVDAWLSRPNLGAVPLFMAGDKHYFYYANKIKNDYKIDSIVFGENLLETTFFKYGFCGIPPNFDRKKSFHLGLESKMKMLSFYLKEFLSNSKYMNKSLFDSFKGFLSFYFISHQYTNIYNYLEWDENTVNSTLIDKYNWEIDPEYSSTWRIGDGTAAFYNLIYYLYAGFSELDTFRSNQIRNGVLTREKALELVEIEGQPRLDSIQWYFDSIGLNVNESIHRLVHDVKKIKDFSNKFEIFSRKL